MPEAELKTGLAADKVLLIRADAGPTIGTGHVMRCLALAQAWRDHGGQVFVAAAELPAALARRLQAEGCCLQPWAVAAGSPDDETATLAMAERLAADWVVLDGYHFAPGFAASLTAAGHQVLQLVDDERHDDVAATMVLNQNRHVDVGGMAIGCGASQRRLLGTRYALLRREFRQQRAMPRPVGPVRHVLVTMGGADPAGLTPIVLQALRGCAGIETVFVLLGAANVKREAVVPLAEALPFPVQVRMDEPQVAEVMASTDLAMAAAGSTAWELACMGVPSLLMVAAENQRPVAATMQAAGAARVTEAENLGRDLATLWRDEEGRQAMGVAGRRLVDGFGAGRVVAAMLDWPIALRLAGTDDCRLVWEWANDPDARAASFSSAAIPWEDHQHWFADQLADPQTLFFIAENRQGRPAGQVRFALEDDAAVISVSLASEMRGQALGSTLIALASAEAFALRDYRCILAYIKPENERSLRAFERAGYERLGIRAYRGHEAWTLQLERGTEP